MVFERDFRVGLLRLPAPVPRRQAVALVFGVREPSADVGPIEADAGQHRHDRQADLTQMVDGALTTAQECGQFPLQEQSLNAADPRRALGAIVMRRGSGGQRLVAGEGS
jgi:hypothetical protein